MPGFMTTHAQTDATTHLSHAGRRVCSIPGVPRRVHPSGSTRPTPFPRRSFACFAGAAGRRRPPLGVRSAHPDEVTKSTRTTSSSTATTRRTYRQYVIIFIISAVEVQARSARGDEGDGACDLVDAPREERHGAEDDGDEKLGGNGARQVSDGTFVCMICVRDRVRHHVHRRWWSCPIDCNRNIECAFGGCVAMNVLGWLADARTRPAPNTSQQRST